LKRIIRHTIAVLNNKERKLLGRLTLLNALVSLADIAFLAMLLLVVAIYTQPERFSDPGTIVYRLQQIHFLLPVIVFLTLFIIKNIIGYYAGKLQYHFVYHVASRISRANILKYLNGSYSGYVQVDSSVRIRQISHQPVEFCHYVLSGMQQLFTETVMVSIAVIAILLFNAQLFLLLLLVLLPPVILTAYYSRRKLKATRTQVKEYAEKTTQYLQEALSGYVESNIYNKGSFFSQRYASYQKKLNDHLASLQTVQAMPSRFIEIFAVLGLFLLILVNKYGGNTTTGIISIGAFMAAAYKIIPGITRIANISSQMRTYEFTIKDCTDTRGNAAVPYNMIKESVTSVTFRNVSYVHEDKAIIHALNLELANGDFAALTAVSGKGKTTVINLMLGFLEPTGGDILINGLALKAEERKKYWHDIAYIKQQTFLLHDTITRNITLDDTEVNDERLQQAISAAGLLPFIRSFREGADKVISDSGKNISGGQRQRLAIARALYKNAHIIILDEPFNELDQHSEQAVLHYLQEQAAQGKIVLLVSHHQSSLAFCNKIIPVNETQDLSHT
jgi:ABC-type bacteriocin/lantibiotic exporter with double-glycine peptidase domain